MEIMVSKMVMSCFSLDGGDDDYNDDERRGDVNFIPQNSKRAKGNERS